MSDCTTLSLSDAQLDLLREVLVTALRRQHANGQFNGIKHKAGRTAVKPTALGSLFSHITKTVSDDDKWGPSYGLGSYSEARPRDITRAYTLAKSLIRSYVNNEGCITDDNAIPSGPIARYTEFISNEVTGISPSRAYDIVIDAVADMGFTAIKPDPDKRSTYDFYFYLPE